MSSETTLQKAQTALRAMLKLNQKNYPRGALIALLAIMEITEIVDKETEGDE